MAQTESEQTTPQEQPTKGIKGFLERHGKKLWWAHSIWALSWGIFFMSLGSEGMGYARWLLLFVCILWLVVVFFFRAVGVGGEQKRETKSQKVRFYAMTYVMKNLYQSMLFFLLPLYYNSSTIGSSNFYFVVLLGVCAVLSTFDVIFDNYVMKWKWLSSLFYVITMFACLNVAVPAVMPTLSLRVNLILAAAISMVAFVLLHVPFKTLVSPKHSTPGAIALLLWVILVYVMRNAIPPVPLHLSHASVGPALEMGVMDGHLAMEITSLHTSRMNEDLYGITEVFVPGGVGDDLYHVWRHDGPTSGVYEAKETVRVPSPDGTIRLQSRLPTEQLPEDRSGTWTLNVETPDGRLIGRSSFNVLP
jgi:hypothetical protein